MILSGSGSYARHFGALKIAWIVLGLLLLIDIVWIRCVGLRVELLNLQMVAASGILFSGASWYTLKKQQRKDMFLVLQSFTLFILGVPIIGALCYLSTRLALPLTDESLIAADRMLGFDWHRYVDWVMTHPVLRGFLRLGYALMYPQIIASLWILAYLKQPQEMQRFVLTLLLALLVTIIFAALFPAVGAYIHYDLNPEDSGIRALAGRRHEADFLALRNHTMVELSFRSKGLVTFPSYHTAVALIGMWLTRRVRWLFLIAFVSGTLNILSTPVDGGHYLMDILGGAVVAACSILLVYRWLPETACKPQPDSLSSGH